jgi:hypothetical protein
MVALDGNINVYFTRRFIVETEYAPLPRRGLNPGFGLNKIYYYITLAWEQRNSLFEKKTVTMIRVSQR